MNNLTLFCKTVYPFNLARYIVNAECIILYILTLLALCCPLSIAGFSNYVMMLKGMLRRWESGKASYCVCSVTLNGSNICWESMLCIEVMYAFKTLFLPSDIGGSDLLVTMIQTHQLSKCTVISDLKLENPSQNLLCLSSAQVFQGSLKKFENIVTMQ